MRIFRHKINLMKNEYCILFIVLLFFSCSKSPQTKNIPVDLNMGTGDIRYSQLIDSLEYITLHSCLMSGEIEKIAMDGDTLLIHDNRTGVFVFTHDGGYICQVNPVGNTPSVYVNITSVAFDTEANRICIFSAPSQQVLSYTYQGEFIEAVSSHGQMQEFAVTGNSDYIINASAQSNNPASQYPRLGVWVTDRANQFKRQLLNNVPAGSLMNISYSPYNPTPDGVYYYDDIYNSLYFLTNETAEQLYIFTLKQALPAELRNQSAPAATALNGHSYLVNYNLSPSYGLFTYYLFGEDPGVYENCFRWVLLDRTDNIIAGIGTHFINDLDSIQTYDWKLRFVNESLWCRVLDPKNNDCSITLQLMHLKKEEQ